MARRPLLVALVVAVVVLGGCWADDDADPVVAGDDDPADQSEQTEPASPTDRTEPDAGPPPRFADAGPVRAPEGAPTADELRALMPDAEELGRRFVLIDEPLYDVGDEPAQPLCPAGWTGNAIAEMVNEPHDVGGGTAVFYAYDPEDEGPLVGIRAASMPDAAGHVADAGAQAEACAAAGPVSEEEGMEARFESGPDPGLGDAGVAYSGTRELTWPGGASMTTRTDVTLVAVGDVVVAFTHLPPADVPQGPPTEDLDPAVLEAVVAAVVDRVAALR